VVFFSACTCVRGVSHQTAGLASMESLTVNNKNEKTYYQQHFLNMLQPKNYAAKQSTVYKCFASE